uniref:Uncharacterized protein n=1 Tax=Engystomops pustulosus TaxID=76066 RepID=A0AAV6YKM9_ENGPU|nr:hypothetical protein GDO81_023996 [Engystomops pustulosus]
MAVYKCSQLPFIWVHREVLIAYLYLVCFFGFREDERNNVMLEQLKCYHHKGSPLILNSVAPVGIEISVYPQNYNSRHCANCVKSQSHYEQVATHCYNRLVFCHCCIIPLTIIYSLAENPLYIYL